MKNRIKVTKLITVFMSVFAFIAISFSSVYAETPYKTYTVDGYGNLLETQTAYLAYETIVKFDDESFSSPSDMCVTEDGEIYVADTGNARIVVGDIDGNLIKIVGEGTLVSPRGVYVTDDKHIYVADRDASAIFEFDEDGTLLNTYGKPDSPLYGNNLNFMPIKVVVNDSGIMFAICESNTNGIVEISPAEGGTFLGYFGTNTASADIMTIIYRAILTDQQRARMVSNIPATPDNLAIDQKGLIYTVTRGDGNNTLKRLNIAGTNLIPRAEEVDVPAAVAAGNNDNVFVADQSGYIYEYDEEGNLIFIFGGSDDGSQRVGLSSIVSAISVDSQSRVYVLDTDSSRVQVYEPTEFTNLLHEAQSLFSAGKYTESKEPLEEILKMNSMFAYANQTMGRVYFQEEDYETALSYARLSIDYDGYSEAYWEIRNVWLKKYIVPAFLAIVGLFILVKVLKFLDKKKNIFKKFRQLKERMHKNKVMYNLSYTKFYMKHPVDGSYGLAREGRASWAVPMILMAIMIIEYVINKYFGGFLWKMIRDGRYELLTDIGIIIIGIFAVTICNYLVCTINDGEGTVKKILCYVTYSLRPYLILTPVIFILSHVLTVNEQVVISLLRVVMYGWILVIGFIGIKEVNQYTVKETIKVILLTIFTILIMALLIFIIYILWAQVFDFISEIVGEVVYRVG